MSTPTKTTQPLSVADLFCGSGGLSRGLVDAGFEVVSAYDYWKDCVDTYQRNISRHAQVLDLSNVAEAIEIVKPQQVDLITGGPPCQDFSTAGKRVEASNASLTTCFAEIVSACRPKFVLMENVPQARKSRAYKQMKMILKDYDFSEVVLNASRYGVPQRRKRFFAFGALGKTNEFCEWLRENRSEDELTVKEYLKDDINIDYYYRHPRNYSRRSVFTVHEPSPTIRGVNRPVPPNYVGNHLDSAPPNSVRPLTTIERSRIQSFPSSWNWDAGDRNASAEQQIGNAVPPNLARSVGSAILNAIA